jgi:hypothetical protein
LILNQGFNYLSNGALGEDNYAVEVAVGTGTSQPSVVETGLQNFIAGVSSPTSNTFTAEGSEPYYGSRTLTWRFGEGDAEGILAEVGVGRGNTNLDGTDLFSRARIQVAGVDGTIEVLDDEWLDVTYQLRAYPGVLVDAAGNFDISTVDTAYVLRNGSVASANSWGLPVGVRGFPDNPGEGNYITAYEATSVLGAVTGSPTGGSDNWSAFSTGTYSADSFTQNVTFSGGLNDGNLTGGIGVFRLRTNLGHIQFSLIPVLAKDNTKVFDITLNYVWGPVVIP